METQGISFLSSINKSSFTDHSVRQQSQAQKLSQDEQSMINKAFDRKSVSLDLYGGSGKVRTEQPNARGCNIDITV